MLRLTHINLPARDPEGLARWYGKTLNLQHDGTFVGGPGILIAFEAGEPEARTDNTHFGFEVESATAVRVWADRLGDSESLLIEEGHASIKVRDPEGNMFEIYCDATPMWKGSTHPHTESDDGE